MLAVPRAGARLAWWIILTLNNKALQLTISQWDPCKLKFVWLCAYLQISIINYINSITHSWCYKMDVAHKRNWPATMLDCDLYYLLANRYGSALPMHLQTAFSAQSLLTWAWKDRYKHTQTFHGFALYNLHVNCFLCSSATMATS